MSRKLVVPVPWLVQAAKLPGRALGAGLLIWLLSKAGRNRRVTVATHWQRLFGMSSEVFRRSLLTLETSGLVAVYRRPGARPVIGIVDVPNLETEELQKWM